LILPPFSGGVETFGRIGGPGFGVHAIPAAAAESPEGSGVGLSLVSDLTLRHGGEVRLVSALGEGSKFTVAIPVGRSHLDDDEIVAGDDGRGQAIDRSAIEQVVSARRRYKAPGLDSAPPAPPGRGEGLRVLIVEDNPDLRGYLVQMLAADYAVEAVGDGHQAVEAVLRDPPDLVITDVVMPNVDGLELLAKLRADERTLQIPVMMLSARGGEEAMVGGLEAGADDYLVKPFTARELRARVAAVLELDRTRRAHTAFERKSTLLEEAQMMAKLGSWEYDPQTGSVQVTDETLRILGLDTQPGPMPLEQLMEEHVAPEYRNEVRLALQDAIRDRPFSIEIKILSARGEERLIRCAGRRAEDQLDDGPRIRGSAQDITEQVAIRTERLIADTLQRSLLPERAFTSSRLEVVGEYLPGVEGTQVGGDWFDVIELDPDRTALVIGDVMGRGIAAASAMGKMRTAIRAYARLGLPPTEVVRMLDELVAELVDEQLVTMIFGVHDAAAGSFTWVNAGHLPPLLRSGQDARMLATADSPPIVPGAPFPERTQREVQIGPGDLLVLYTDGLVERREGSIDDEFERLVGAVGRAEGTARQMSSSVLAALGADGSGDDDIALLVAHVLR
jgi:DNA-binding response OmpR family regulator